MALDLEELRKSLDDALNKETKESLTEWLESIRKEEELYTNDSGKPLGHNESEE